MENMTSQSQSNMYNANNLVTGYTPRQNNFGKPMFPDYIGKQDKSLGDLEGRTARERLSDLAKKRGLYKQANNEIYNVIKEMEKKKDYREEEVDDSEEGYNLLDEDWESLFGRFKVPMPTRGRYNYVGPRKEESPDGENKKYYAAIKDYLKKLGGNAPGAGDGAIIFANGEQYGSYDDVAGADRLLQRYGSFANSYVGKQLFKDLGNQPKFDGYAFMDLGKGVLGAMISVNDKNILAINKRYACQLEGTALETYVLAHESVHGLGERSEYKTDKKLYDSFSRSAERSSSGQRGAYQDLASIGKQYTSARAA